MSGLGSTSSYLYQIASYLGISITLFIVVAFLLLLFVYRAVRTLIGEKFSDTRIFLTPIFYSILVMLSFISSDYIQQLSASVTAALGIGVGLKLSRKVEVYDKKEMLYYRKSLSVTLLWSLFFSVKILTYLYYPEYYFQTLFTVLLTLVTGMIVGEALRIFYRGKTYRPVQVE